MRSPYRSLQLGVDSYVTMCYSSYTYQIDKSFVKQFQQWGCFAFQTLSQFLSTCRFWGNSDYKKNSNKQVRLICESTENKFTALAVPSGISPTLELLLHLE